jgi:hypothetical protein
MPEVRNLTIKISNRTTREERRVQIDVIDTSGRMEVLVPTGFALHARAGISSPWTPVRLLSNGTWIYQHD